jgi:hypothetical protein
MMKGSTLVSAVELSTQGVPDTAGEDCSDAALEFVSNALEGWGRERDRAGYIGWQCCWEG